MKNFKVAVVIPSRGNRPRFLSNCLRLVESQTLQPTCIVLKDYPPESSDYDITQRYRRAYDDLRNCGLDAIAFMEDDDWYAKDYLEIMVKKWHELGRPEILSTNYTIYYHIKLFARFTMFHDSRGPAMATIIKPDMHFGWCPDFEPYTDSHLWFSAKHVHTGGNLKGVTFKPDKDICMGIKHAVGKTGGRSHDTDLHRYTQGSSAKPDYDKSFLKSLVDPESFDFYNNFFTEI